MMFLTEIFLFESDTKENCSEDFSNIVFKELISTFRNKNRGEEEEKKRWFSNDGCTKMEGGGI